MRKPPIRDRKADFRPAEIAAPPQSQPLHPDRRLFDLALETPLSDREWNGLQNSEIYLRFQKKQADPHLVVADIEQSRETWGKSPRIRTELPPRAADAALNDILASFARKAEFVVAFRALHLGGKTLTPAKIYPWLSDQEVKDGVFKMRSGPQWRRIDAKPEEVSMIWACELAVQKSYHLGRLGFRTPGGGGLVSVNWGDANEPRPVLAQLWAVSDWLCRTYGWQQADAVTFILADTPPPPRPFVAFLASIHPTYPALSQLTMTLSPEISPKELAQAYREFRKRHFRSRVRSMTPKHIALAVFYGTREKEAKWKELMAEWNKSAEPDWKYRTERNFERDCKQARRRILGTYGAK